MCLSEAQLSEETQARKREASGQAAGAASALACRILTSITLITFRWLELFWWLPGSTKALGELEFANDSAKDQKKFSLPPSSIGTKCLHGLHEPKKSVPEGPLSLNDYDK